MPSGQNFADAAYALLLASDNQQAFLTAVCERMHATAGAIWSNSLFVHDKFVLRCVKNRPNATKLVGLIHFTLSDDDLFCEEAITTGEVVIKSSNKDANFESWLNKSYTEDLQELNIEHVVVVPVSLVLRNLQVVISLYYQHPPRIDVHRLQNLCKICMTAIDMSTNKSDYFRLERSKDRHEVRAHMRIIEEKITRISHIIDENTKRFPDPKLIHNIFTDALESLNVLKLSYERGSFKERILRRKSSAFHIPISSFLINTAAAAVRDNPLRNKTSCLPVRSVDIDVLFFEEDLSTLFINIYSNAVKHSIPGSAVKTVLSPTHGNLTISVENDVEIGRSDDLEKIWKYEYRGDHSVTTRIPGDGIGLGLVADICDVYGIGLSGKYVDVEDRRNTKIFRVSLVFPSELCSGRGMNVRT